jgi:hypothetical protein
MWATLALMSALSSTPAQGGQLEVKNVRVTYGILGQERKDTTYLPGDLVVLAFDMEGLQVAPDGTVKYSTSMELIGADPMTGKPKTHFKQDPQEMTTVNTLGGSRLPSFALAEIGTDTAPGKYTMSVVVTDVAAKKSVKLERGFEVKKSEFGIVRPGFTYIDMNERSRGAPQIAPPVGVPGQNLLLNFAVVGFELKGQMQVPNVTVQMEVKDESGEGVKKPYTGKVENLEDNFKKLRYIPFQFPMQLNRSGKFKVVLKATDVHTGKTATQTLDLKVIEVNP